MTLGRFFDDAIRRSLRDLARCEDPAAEYLGDLLARFARTEALYPRAFRTPRLETVADSLLEIEHVWEAKSPHFHPEREIALRRHIGDFTLFMTGVFHERVEHFSGTRYYIREGKRAYRFVSEHERASVIDASLGSPGAAPRTSIDASLGSPGAAPRTSTDASLGSPGAAPRTSTPHAQLFRRLSDQFEGYVGVLDYARKVYFRDPPDHPFFRVAFG